MLLPLILLTKADSKSRITGMRTVFIADAHLENPSDTNYLLLLAFLEELQGKTETLYIMGDLFDFWLGFPENPFRQYDPVIEALVLLHRSGCRIVYFEGNHDFHLGAVFREKIKAKVHRYPAGATIQGRRLYLCHGDQINRSDYGYLALRALTHNAAVGSLVNLLPPALAMKAREVLQRISKKGYAEKNARWNHHDVIGSFAERVRGEGYDGLVCGHFHLAMCEKYQAPDFTLLSLGDWIDSFTYGEMIDGELFLRSYSPIDAI